MEWILEFLNSEKSLFLSAGILGAISLVVGLLFLIFSTHKTFAITMIVIGVLEMVMMFPTYAKYQQKIDTKITTYESNVTGFIETESITTQEALNSFFRLKLVYGVLIVVLSLAMSYIDEKSFLLGVFAALIIHLALAITIDNFGEKYTKTYLTELTNA